MGKRQYKSVMKSFRDRFLSACLGRSVTTMPLADDDYDYWDANSPGGLADDHPAAVIPAKVFDSENPPYITRLKLYGFREHREYQDLDLERADQVLQTINMLSNYVTVSHYPPRDMTCPWVNILTEILHRENYREVFFKRFEEALNRSYARDRLRTL